MAKKKSPVKAMHTKISPMVALLVVEKLGSCSSADLIEQIKQNMRIETKEEFERAANHSFTPSVITPLLEKGWLIRKYERAEYIFYITPAGKAEIDRQF